MPFVPQPMRPPPPKLVPHPFKFVHNQLEAVSVRGMLALMLNYKCSLALSGLTTKQAAYNDQHSSYRQAMVMMIKMNICYRFTYLSKIHHLLAASGQLAHKQPSLSMYP